MKFSQNMPTRPFLLDKRKGRACPQLDWGMEFEVRGQGTFSVAVSTSINSTPNPPLILEEGNEKLAVLFFAKFGGLFWRNGVNYYAGIHFYSCPNTVARLDFEVKMLISVRDYLVERKVVG